MMIRASIAIVATTAAVLVVSVGASGKTATPTLKGTVGPGYTITLTMNGKKVKSLKRGTYKFAVADKSTFHNFTVEREKGGKFEKDLTSVSFTGNKTVTLKLGAGSWKYYCKVHEPMMYGFFKVT
jgi:plastocyanin